MHQKVCRLQVAQALPLPRGERLREGLPFVGCKDESQKMVNEIYLKTWAKGEFEFTPTDSAILQTIADYNVEDCGIAVYDARVMLRYDKDDFQRDEKRMAIQIPDVIDDGYGIMYPNPANTVAYYETELKEGQSGFVQLFDVLGNSVSTKKLIAGTNKAQFDLTNLSSGIYIYKVMIGNKLITFNKLVITK